MIDTAGKTQVDYLYLQSQLSGGRQYQSPQAAVS